MLTFTERARDVLRTYLDQNEGELDTLRITVHGSPAAPRYELTLVASEELGEGDVEVEAPDISVVAPSEDAPLLQGATVDYVERVNESGFEIRTSPAAEAAAVGAGGNGGGAGPGAGAAAGRSGAPPTGPLAEKVLEVLDSQINPAIASHGGQIHLVDVRDTELFIEMSGGCQGCAMSRMTLRQGVERMIRQSVPEVTEIHDVTDHASGENPYFEAPV